MLASLIALLPLIGSAAAAVPTSWGSIALKNSCTDKISVGLMGYSNPTPGPINVAAGAKEMVNVPNFEGVVYAVKDAKSQWGLAGTTKAALSFKTGSYYILKDGYNVPVRISPPVAAAPAAKRRLDARAAAACPVAECADDKCTDSSATWLGFPAAGTAAHTCEVAGDWTIEFCPKKATEPSKGVEIHFNGNKKLCLDVQNNNQADGTPVQIYECNGTGAQKWEISHGQTAVRLAGTNFCLDAGSAPGPNVNMKIWTCYDKIPAQTMWYTDDNRIAVKDTGLCLTLPGGKTQNGVVPQTQWCTDNNANQVWN